MKKNKIHIMIVGILVLSSIGIPLGHAEHQTSHSVTDSIITPQINIQTSSVDQSVFVTMKDIATYLSIPGHPRLPILIKTYELPFAATNILVNVNPTDITTLDITGDIRPCPPMLLLTDTLDTEKHDTITKDPTIYSMTTPYPSTWYSTKIGVGLNKNNQRVTFVSVHIYPLRYTPTTRRLTIAKTTEIHVSYTSPAPNPLSSIKESYDLVIIAPKSFEKQLQPLITHKNNHGVKTFLKTTEDIYVNYEGVDKPAQIKNFIKDAIETFGITSVLLVGGLKNVVCARPRDDANQGSKGWHVPVRYTNLYDNPKFPLSGSAIFDPGVISDLYYADIYRIGGVFSDWDVNGDGIFAGWGKPGYANDTGIDMYPDVNLGRLACANKREVETVVQKIITYETTTAGKEWFKKMIVVSGDGFLDQQDLNIQWDTKPLPNGAYTIYAQSSNPTGDFGPIETINITIDKTKETLLTYNHDDYLRTTTYPGLPIAEITTVTEGNILGNTDYTYVPSESEAYCNEFYFWGNISYLNGVLTIRGKSYDPKPYGNKSNIHVWIKNSADQIVFEDWRNNTEMYYEGEWTTGEKALLGRGGALYYMPADFDREIIWTSNGRLTGQQAVLDAWTTGCGFLFFSGHGSPNVWADHYPGVPGNRQKGSVTGMQVTTLRPWSPFVTRPAFPMDTVNNKEKLPIAVVGGCHNSQFNVSMVYGLLDILHYYFPRFPKLYMWCHGVPVPQTFSWRMVRNPRGGAIASIGNTGLGYGMPGIDLTTGGGDGWITIEFFRQYGEYGVDILGQTHAQTVTSYLNTFDITDLAAGHPKTVQQWVLLGDPTLKIGGYE
ncbi:MAG: C25 family cysteine peptidase [Candidatus Thermoplasmatota archaeon]